MAEVTSQIYKIHPYRNTEHAHILNMDFQRLSSIRTALFKKEKAYIYKARTC